jgi:hypothetical protein
VPQITNKLLLHCVFYVQAAAVTQLTATRSQTSGAPKAL